MYFLMSSESTHHLQELLDEISDLGVQTNSSGISTLQTHFSAFVFSEVYAPRQYC